MYNVQSEPEITEMHVVFVYTFTLKMSLSLVICKWFVEQYSRNSSDAN